MKQIIFLSALIATAIAVCPNDEYCANCDGAVCQTCVNSFVSNGLCTKYTTEVDNCYSYSSATACRNCNSGYYLSGNSCARINISNCAEVDAGAPTKCITCDNGKLPLNGSCSDGPSCGLDNCDVCRYANRSTGVTPATDAANGSAVCVTCSNNYSVTSTGTCIAEPTDNCLSATNATTCALCYRGYYDNGDTCKSTNVQGSGVQIFATLASVIALVLFL